MSAEYTILYPGQCCPGWCVDDLLHDLRRDQADRLVEVLPEVATKALRDALAGIKTHNGQPLSPTNLRWAATHEALCRSFIFDVLMALADALAPTDNEGGQ